MDKPDQDERPTDECAEMELEHAEYRERALTRLAEARRYLGVVKAEAASGTAIDPSLIRRLENDLRNLERLMKAGASH